MAFDATFLSGVLREIQKETAEARVEKIHQPARDTVILHLRCREGRKKLLIAANPAAPRLHLTEANPENPDSPYVLYAASEAPAGRKTAVDGAAPYGAAGLVCVFLHQ